MEADVCVNLIGVDVGATKTILSPTGAIGGTIGDEDDGLGHFAVLRDDRGYRTVDLDKGRTNADSADDDDGPGDQLVTRSTPGPLGPPGPFGPPGLISTILPTGVAGNLDLDGRMVILEGSDQSKVDSELRSEVGKDSGGDSETGLCRDCCAQDELGECGSVGGRCPLDCDSVKSSEFSFSPDHELRKDSLVSEGVPLETNCLKEKAQHKFCTDSGCLISVIDSERNDNLEKICNQRDASIIDTSHDADVIVKNECADDHVIIVASAIVEFVDQSSEAMTSGVLNPETVAMSNVDADNAERIMETRNTEEDGKDSGANQLLLPTASENGVDAECLSPTVNLEFSVVYWSKEKSKSEKGDEAPSVALTSKRGLHVKFAEEELLVTGFMEPAIPWKEAWLCSTSELVTAYKTACESNGVKPLKKLLVQLEGIKRFDIRSDLLSLKGESLDWKHCETLEEIFKRVQFHTINMEEMRLDDDVAVTIFDLLHYYQSCVHLIMNKSTNLGTRGWQAWTKLMKQSTGLVHLEARGLTIPDHTLPVIGKYLRTGSMLHTLQLENSIRSGRHLNLLAGAMKTSQSVQELYLGANQLSPSDGLQLGTMLKGNTTLRLLDIRHNNLQDTGMGHICDGIAEQKLEGKGLNTLVVWNNQLSHLSMPALSKALTATKSLETLNIGHNNITNDGIHRLKDGLMQNKSLLRLGLQATKLSCEGAVALAEFVAESTQMLRLDLRENSIKTAGLMALSHSLKVNKTVTCVDLDREPKKESDMKDFAEQQNRLLNDIKSFVMRNSAESQSSADSVANPSVNEIGLDIQSSSTVESTTSSDKEEVEITVKTQEPTDVCRSSTLSLPLGNTTRCQTLESPSYSPELLSLCMSPAEKDLVVVEIATDLSSSPSPSSAASASAADSTGATSLTAASNVSETSKRSSGLVMPDSAQNSISVSAENQKNVVPSLSLTETVKPPVPDKSAVLDKKPIKTKRKFMISKAVLPSVLSAKPVNAAAAAVLFTARPSSNSSDSSLDSDTHVCIVGTSVPESASNLTDSSKKETSELNLHPLVKNFTTITTEASKSDDVKTLPEANVTAKTVSNISLMSSTSADGGEAGLTVGLTEIVASAQSVSVKSDLESDTLVQVMIPSELSTNAAVPVSTESFLPSCLLDGKGGEHPIVGISAQEPGQLVDISERNLGRACTESSDLSSNVSIDCAHFAPTPPVTQSTVHVETSSVLVMNSLSQNFELSSESCRSEVRHNEQPGLVEVIAEKCAIESEKLAGDLDISIAGRVTEISGTGLDDSEFTSRNLYLPSTEKCANTETVGIIPDGIRLQLYSAETEDEATNILVSVSTVDTLDASKYQLLGNFGLRCFDLTAISMSNGKNRSSVSSSSEGIDMIFSDCEDSRTVDDEKISESSEMEIGGWRTGEFVKESSEDSLFLGTSDESIDGDGNGAVEVSSMSTITAAVVDRVVDGMVHAFDSVGTNISRP